MAVKMLWSLCILVLLLPACSAHSHKGLVCTNDLVNNVSCLWTGSWEGSGEDCWISGAKELWKIRNVEEMIRRCKVTRRENSPPGCSLVFENTVFFTSEVIPNIWMTCDGKIIQNLTNYSLKDHIKMQPPDTPRINSTANFTIITWSLHSVSYLFKNTFDFHVQIRQSGQSWEKSSDFYPDEPQMKVSVLDLKGLLEVRVRVKPSNRDKSRWSDWSSTASYLEPDKKKTSTKQVWWLDWTSQMGVALAVVGLLLGCCWALYKLCKTRRILGWKPLPDPSKYLQTIHKGDQMKWLNPESATESFFVAQSCDNISPVEVCGNWDEVVPSPCPSSSSTSALFYVQDSTDSSRVAYNSSQSSFSNVGYFMSSTSGGSAQTTPDPAYFTYNDHVHNLPVRVLHPSLCDEFTSYPDYECLKREPESPDSGFGIMKEEEKNNPSCIEREVVLNNHSSCVFLCVPSHTRPPSSPPAPPHPPTVAQIPSDSRQPGVSESTAAMSRSSSMPVEASKTGYLTLKELQTTFSNKSI